MTDPSGQVCVVGAGRLVSLSMIVTTALREITALLAALRCTPNVSELSTWLSSRMVTGNVAVVCVAAESQRA
jgi:hypothetical protein